MQVKSMLRAVQQRLVSCSSSPSLDGQLLMMHVLDVSRAWLFAHDDHLVSVADQARFLRLVERRCAGEPVAYLLGEQEFYSLTFKVNSNVLVPRPETECLVDWILAQSWGHDLKAIDLGTGSGAIAVALGCSRPTWTLVATDVSDKALAVAQQNIEQHNVSNVTCLHSDWFEGVAEMDFDLVVSNPPYIAPGDKNLSSLGHEPYSALVAKNKGLADIDTILEQATGRLVAGGRVVIEHGYDQAESVGQLALKWGYVNVQAHRDLAGVPRFLVATWP